MATVWIPAPLRDLTGGQDKVDVAGARVSQIIDGLDRQFPGIRVRLCDAAGLKAGIAVFVGHERAPLGLLAPVEPESEVHFIPAIGGGA